MDAIRKIKTKDISNREKLDAILAIDYMPVDDPFVEWAIKALSDDLFFADLWKWLAERMRLREGDGFKSINLFIKLFEAISIQDGLNNCSSVLIYAFELFEKCSQASADQLVSLLNKISKAHLNSEMADRWIDELISRILVSLKSHQNKRKNFELTTSNLETFLDPCVYRVSKAKIDELITFSLFNSEVTVAFVDVLSTLPKITAALGFQKDLFLRYVDLSGLHIATLAYLYLQKSSVGSKAKEKTLFVEFSIKSILNSSASDFLSIAAILESANGCKLFNVMKQDLYTKQFEFLQSLFDQMIKSKAFRAIHQLLLIDPQTIENHDLVILECLKDPGHDAQKLLSEFSRHYGSSGRLGEFIRNVSEMFRTPVEDCLVISIEFLCELELQMSKLSTSQLKLIIDHFDQGDKSPLKRLKTNDQFDCFKKILFNFKCIRQLMPFVDAVGAYEDVDEEILYLNAQYYSLVESKTLDNEFLLRRIIDKSIVSEEETLVNKMKTEKKLIRMTKEIISSDLVKMLKFIPLDASRSCLLLLYLLVSVQFTSVEEETRILDFVSSSNVEISEEFRITFLKRFFSEKSFMVGDQTGVSWFRLLQKISVNETQCSDGPKDVKSWNDLYQLMFSKQSQNKDEISRLLKCDDSRLFRLVDCYYIQILLRPYSNDISKLASILDNIREWSSSLVSASFLFALCKYPDAFDVPQFHKALFEFTLKFSRNSPVCHFLLDTYSGALSIFNWKTLNQLFKEKEYSNFLDLFNSLIRRRQSEIIVGNCNDSKKFIENLILLGSSTDNVSSYLFALNNLLSVKGAYLSFDSLYSILDYFSKILNEKNSDYLFETVVADGKYLYEIICRSLGSMIRREHVDDLLPIIIIQLERLLRFLQVPFSKSIPEDRIRIFGECLQRCLTLLHYPKYKKVVQKHAHYIILSFINSEKSRNQYINKSALNSVKEGIFYQLDTVGEKEGEFIIASMDLNAKSIYQTLFQEYTRNHNQIDALQLNQCLEDPLDFLLGNDQSSMRDHPVLNESTEDLLLLNDYNEFIDIPYREVYVDAIHSQFTNISWNEALKKSGTPLLYINRSQPYPLKIHLSSNSHKKTHILLELSFYFNQDAKRRTQLWKNWALGRNDTGSHHHHRLLNPIEVEAKGIKSIDYRVNAGVLSSCEFEIMGDRNVIQTKFWTNCLSTDFTRSKGVKGLPLKLTVYVFADFGDHVQFSTHEAVIQAFRDKGAERKLKHDRLKRGERDDGEGSAFTKLQKSETKFLSREQYLTKVDEIRQTNTFPISIAHEDRPILQLPTPTSPEGPETMIVYRKKLKPCSTIYIRQKTFENEQSIDSIRKVLLMTGWKVGNQINIPPLLTSIYHPISHVSCHSMLDGYYSSLVKFIQDHISHKYQSFLFLKCIKADVLTPWTPECAMKAFGEEHAYEIILVPVCPAIAPTQDYTSLAIIMFLVQ